MNLIRLDSSSMLAKESNTWLVDCALKCTRWYLHVFKLLYNVVYQTGRRQIFDVKGFVDETDEVSNFHSLFFEVVCF